MLINFQIKNFCSYKMNAELSFVSNAKIKNNKDHEVKLKKINVLKNCALYGANASGKSNIIKALSFMKKMVLNKSDYMDFSFKGNENTPTTFTIVFSNNENIYEYSFSLLNKKNLFDNYKIVKESLHKIYNNKSELFFNLEQDKNVFSKKFLKITYFKAYISGYKRINNQLFLAYISDVDKTIDNEEINTAIRCTYNFFKEELVILSNDNNFNLVNLTNLDNLSLYLKKFDTGIEYLDFINCSFDEINESVNNEILNKYIIEARQNNQKSFCIFNKDKLFCIDLENNVFKKLVCKHRNINNVFNLGNESEGTVRIIFLISMLFEDSLKDKVYVIDEIERSIHPLLSPKLILEFQNLNKNNHKQLLFTTHLVSLMDEVLRRDEIYFCSKNKYGISSIESLLEYASRLDPNISKKYLEGRFGAIPNLMVDL